MKPTYKGFKTILVAGANKYLAKEIIKKLDEDVNNRILAVSQETLQSLPSSVKNYSYYELYTDCNLNNVDIIINCEHPSKIEANNEELQQTFKCALQLMQFCNERWKSKLYINMSYHGVYGEKREIPVNENEDVDSNRLEKYSDYHRQVEIRLKQHANEEVKLINLRLADLIGEFYPQPLIDDMIMEAFSNKCVTPSDIMNRYSFIDILDVANVVNKIIEREDLSIFNGYVYNVGPISEFMSPNFEAITTQNIAEIISNIIPDIKTINNAVNDEYNGNISYLMDSSALYNILHWYPEISIVSSIKSKIMHNII